MEEMEEVQAFEAVLSFVEEFSFDEEAEGRLYTGLQEYPSSNNPVSRPGRCKQPMSNEEKKKRQKEINERRRLLRKAGIYGDSNRVRNERTKEIAVLKEQLEKLKLYLKILKSQHVQEKTNDTAFVARTTSSVPSVWKAQAVRQRRRREETERDNVRLKLAVDRQRKVANNLQNLMQKRASQLTNECASLVDTCCSERNSVNVLDFCGDVEDFRELFFHLDAAYRDVDSVFAANGLTGMTISPHDVHVREGVDSKYLEFSTYKDLPFALHDTTEAAWNHYTGVQKHNGNGSLYQKAAKSLDEPYTVIEDFSKEVYSNTSSADVKVKQIVRRYLEPDRDIVIWVSHCTPAQVKHKLLRGLVYNLRGYCITRRSPLSTPGNEMTQLQMC
ncbi:hypothetical protein DVH05_008194 [Phytophthora capsici]|nr:hypothetical protein DVH05_008194 [Phytophthora capsici]